MTTTTLPTAQELSDVLARNGYEGSFKPWADYMGGQHVRLSFTWSGDVLQGLIDMLAEYGIAARFAVGFAVDVKVAS